MRRKVVIALAVLIFVNAAPVCGQGRRVGTFRFEASRGGHVAKVVFRTRAFDTSRHRVEPGNFQNRIDGRVAYGAEGIPKVEIASMRYFFNGREVVVPRRLYSDCYDPNFDKWNFKMRFARDRRTVLVTMNGSDGAGVVLQKFSEHTRCCAYTTSWAATNCGQKIFCNTTSKPVS